MRTVDALVCLRPGELRVERRAAPRPAHGEILVRPPRVGICGTDYHIFEGKHPFLEYPRVMGHELAVEMVEPATGLSAGDVCVVNPYIACGAWVACRNGNCCVRIAVLGVHRDGGMTDLLAVPAGNLVAAPGLTPDQCATVEFLAIGAHAVRRGAVAARDRVLVIGAGPDRPRRRPLRPPHRGCSRSSRPGRGPPEHGTPADRGRAGAACADPLSCGEPEAAGFDVVFDVTGNPQSMEACFDFVAHGGRCVLVGVVKEPIALSDPDFHRKEMTLLASRNAAAEDFQTTVIAAIRDGAIPLDRIVTHRTTLTGAVRDLPRWATEKFGLVKALVELG